MALQTATCDATTPMNCTKDNIVVPMNLGNELDRVKKMVIIVTASVKWTVIYRMILLYLPNTSLAL